MHPTTFTVTLPGQPQPLTVNLTDLLACFQTVPDQRKRRGVRYPLTVLLTIAVLAMTCSPRTGAITMRVFRYVAPWRHP